MRSTLLIALTGVAVLLGSELSAGSAGDAERAFAEGNLLLSEGTAESKRRARERFQEAAESWKAAGNLAAQADALLALAGIDSDAGRPEEAVAQCEQALELARGAGHRRGEAQALKQLADARIFRHELDEASDLYRQAMEIWRDLGDVAGMGSTLYGMGLALQYQGKNIEALAAQEEAFVLLKEAGDLGRQASCLAAQAGIRSSQGEIGDALRELERALALSRAAGSARAEASVLYNLAILHQHRGELGAALESFESSLAINRRLGDRDNEPRVLHALGSLYVELGEPEKSLDRYEQALELGRELGDFGLQARTLNMLGMVHFLRGDPQTALDYYARSLALSREKRDALSTAAALLRTGEAYARTGRAREALALLEEALALRRESGSLMDQAQVLLARGVVHHSLQEPVRAAHDFRAALDTYRQVGASAQEALCLYRWALLDRETGRPGEALGKVREAVGKIEAIRVRVPGQALRMSYFAAKREYYELYVRLLVALHEADPERGYGTEALEVSEKARARAMLDLLAEGRVDLRGGIDPELKRREIDLEARLSWLQEQLLRNSISSGEGAKIASLFEQRDQAQDDLDRLKMEIRQRHPRYAEVRYPMPLQAAGIHRLLDGETALLQYFVGAAGSYLFTVTRDRLTISPLPPATALAEEVRSLREILQKRGRRLAGSYRDEASRLYNLLIGPAEASLAGKSRLLISPDGALHLLPFEALLTSGSGLSYGDFPYLLRRYSVAYIPSASVLADLRRPRAAPSAQGAAKALLAFADPWNEGPPPAAGNVVAAGSGPPVPKLPRLQGAEREVRSIAALYPPRAVEVFLGRDATEDRVKRSPLVETARGIHFATHGLVEPRLRLSGLMLSRDNSSTEDGILQIHEIFNLRLNAELVVLSACDTGVGGEMAGEGVLGMTRAFLYAGARGLLVSFWPVLDSSTADLMVRFYQNLDIAGSRAEALRKSKLAMIESGDYASPYYWAPFVLAGDQD